MSRSHSIALVFSLLAPMVSAQVSVTLPKPPESITAPASTTGPLHLNVVVSTPGGKPLAGLLQRDFTVSINGKPQPISSFSALPEASAAEPPGEIILLVDTVNTRFSNVAYERSQVDRFLKKNGGKLAQPVKLVILSDTKSVTTPQASSDGNQLAGVLDKANIGLREFGRKDGFYGWVEQFQISATALERLCASEETRPGKKLLIWISPGWPLLSSVEIELSAEDRQRLFNSLVALSASLRKANMTLSSVDPVGVVDAVSYRTQYYKEFLKGVPGPNQMQIGNLALQVLALHSGGRVLDSENDISTEIATAASDAETSYTLTVNSPPAESKNEYRAIAVQVDKPGLVARTRSSYYAQP